MEIAREGEGERERGRERRKGGGAGGVLSSKLCSRLTYSKNDLHTLLIFGGISTCGCSTLRGW